ncbi:MgtC/SapB family protein [Rhodohalobacter sp. 8-1]|uniref:MgtC/SapB family protein n=1 Tax=Rhodohalobacter sp. 8-1 TaxID=3131972 RepID=UPI0030EF41F1
MDYSSQIELKLLVALAIGLLVGIERGWSEREEDEGERIAGIRTFSIIGLLGGVWAMMAEFLGDWILAVAFLSVSALIIAAHILDVRSNQDIGTTTAFSMMLTFALAAWAVIGQPVIAIAVTIVVVFLLGYKPVLHRWLRVIEEKELYAGIKLLIISVALLPFLPDQGYGPYNALNPYWIWWMVVLISGISFVGYFAIKFTGKKKGTFLTAVTGGLASSTAVTFSMAQFAKLSKKKLFFMGGIMIASSIMFIRVAIEVFVVNRELLQHLWIPLGLMFAGILIGGYWFLIRGGQGKEADQQIDITNPFQLGLALRFGVLLALILLLSEAVKEWFGDEGIYLLSVASGLMDVDAITVSLSKMAQNDLSAEVASLGIVLASATNTVVKGFIFAVIAGWKDSLKLILFLTAAVIPGILAGLYLIV